jgi:hypothetical protein
MRSSNTHSRRSMQVVTVAAAFPTIVIRPTLDANTRFASPKAITVITASNTAAIGSGSRHRGPATGSTRRMFLWSTSAAFITFATRRIRESMLNSASPFSATRQAA